MITILVVNYYSSRSVNCSPGVSYQNTYFILNSSYYSQTTQFQTPRSSSGKPMRVKVK